MIEIRYTNGQAPQLTGNLDTAMNLIRQDYPDAVFYDAFGFEILGDDDDIQRDLRRDGGRILAWENETASVNDDGAHAIAGLYWVSLEGTHAYSTEETPHD
jgi:hypothetical protein